MDRLSKALGFFTNSFAKLTYIKATVQGKAWFANNPKKEPAFILISFSEITGFRGGCFLVEVTDTYLYIRANLPIHVSSFEAPDTVMLGFAKLTII